MNGWKPTAIKETRELFGRPSLTFLLRQWFRRRPRLRPHTFEASGGAISPGQTASGQFDTLMNTNPNAPLEQRVELLEKNIKHLRRRIDEAQRELEGEVQKVTDSINEEKSTRMTEDQKVLLRLEATETGGLHISAMGAIWIFFGILLSSLPKELSAWFS